MIKSNNPNQIIWLIGPSIVEQSLDQIEEFYLSRIPGEYDCDRHLQLDRIEALFEKTWSEPHPEVTFEIWNKK